MLQSHCHALRDEKTINKTQARRPAFFLNKYRIFGKKDSEIMTLRKQFFFVLVLVCQLVLSQNDTIFLKDVQVSDLNLTTFSGSLSVQKLNDSIIAKNQSSLTSLLNYNSVVYFKENGLGMVSSPSFRGTTAQQTAVIWNGININSQFNGQTDFNTITTRNYNSVTVRAGGGSAIYGSSAIGGSIHLNNEMVFKNKFENDLFLCYGSFNTFDSSFRSTFSNNKVSVNFNFSQNSSDNDYPFLNSNLKNTNGQFYNNSYNFSFGYKLNKSNIFRIYSQFYDSERHFSAAIESKSESKYQDVNSRNLVEWFYSTSKIVSNFKLAFLTEKYRYFNNYNFENFETSNAETFIIKYGLEYKFSPKIKLNGIIDYSGTKGIGKNIGENKRDIGAFSLLLNHKISTYFQYDLSIRKEVTDAYESPILMAFGSNFNVNSNYKIKLNISKNFRIPTFNDLYWVGSGNPNLKPESAIQSEIGHELAFKNIDIKVTSYYNSISNLIRWIPQNSVWKPENIDNVTSYGNEVLVNYKKQIAKHFFQVNSSYAYTISENEKTSKQLTYVPFHKFTAGFAYNFKKLNVNYQYLFNGFVYTQSDHEAFIKSYNVSNLALAYDFGKENKYKLGFQTQNLFNENYQSVAYRPLPGRNYLINLTLKL